MDPDILIYTTNHETRSVDIPIFKQGETKPNPVDIEDDVWIGARAIILPGVTIAHGSVVFGGGTVATKTFPPYSVICGNPGRVMKNRGENSNDCDAE